jgi:uncharacterized membrane protein YfcA
LDLTGLILLGVVAGVISGALGLGSGTILIPALVLLFHFGQKSAQGTALAVMPLMALVAALLYWRDEKIEVDLVAAAIITAASLVGVVIGYQFCKSVPVATLKRIFAVYLLAVAAKMLIFPALPEKRGAKQTDETQKKALIERQNESGSIQDSQTG